ncbi:MAG: Lrp/AsnC family transcriptional regulator [Nanoarchaeota archaeon]
MMYRDGFRHKDLLLLSNLRRNARATLTDLSAITKVPISTVHDRLKSQRVIRRHTCILDFSALGFTTLATIFLRVRKEDKDGLSAFLLQDFHVNSLFKVNSGYDLMMEGVFRNIKELEDFVERLEDGYRIRSKQVFYIIEELVRERFLGDDASVERLTKTL